MATKSYWPNRIAVKKIRSGNSTKAIGNKAEKLAQKFIRSSGLKLIASNVRYSFGEIDLIAEDSDELVFIEVRFRSNSSHGLAAETVGSQKQRRLVSAAQAWLRDNQTYCNHYCRFDVIAIDSLIDTKHISWQKNAFQVPGYD
jgi:putative endonuclease